MTRINPVMPFAFMGGLNMFGALLCSILPGDEAPLKSSKTPRKNEVDFVFIQETDRHRLEWNHNPSTLPPCTGDLLSLLHVSRVLYWYPEDMGLSLVQA